MANPPAPKTRRATTSLAARFGVLSTYFYALLISPLLLAHFAFDILLCVPPWTRPAREWTFNQAARNRLVRLLLLCWSLTRSGDRLTLRPGREGARFEVLRARPRGEYTGVLCSDGAVQPADVGATWTPAPLQLVAPDVVVVALHFHGGACATGTGRDDDTGFLARTLLRYLGCSHDALTAYLCLVRDKGVPPRRIILSGDSAGANLALALLRYLREHGEGLGAPGAVALWSPWVDVGGALRLDMRASPNYATDYLHREFGRWGAAAVSGHGAVDASGPWLAPLLHPFAPAGDVPVFVHAGEREVLYHDMKLFSERYRDAGWNVRLLVSKGCPHDVILLGPRIGFARAAEAAARDARTFFAAATDLKLRVT
ncbi:Alpha/Beta hydrolase protein [Lasiosphaeria miniovina]|uniref:Alpha/Beta hydrolase protein n=1 Tax=Lasiosphaeria miniovina TaxID=1954250 RepID=A0AA40AML4_9PEZI|nr:Alpha/Beta hydrolase protein [Lasiosphaeria miniovina]KAK0718604.1 Alpha/Beta hydrolase protein [Lasiosphaeria miniovina]